MSLKKCKFTFSIREYCLATLEKNNPMFFNPSVEYSIWCTFFSSSRLSKQKKKDQIFNDLNLKDRRYGYRLSEAKWKWDEEDVRKIIARRCKKQIQEPIEEIFHCIGEILCVSSDETKSRGGCVGRFHGESVPIDAFGFIFPKVATKSASDKCPVTWLIKGRQKKFLYVPRKFKKDDGERRLSGTIDKIQIDNVVINETFFGGGNGCA